MNTFNKTIQPELSMDLIVPPNGLYEMPHQPEYPDYEAMRRPVESLRMVKQKEVLVDRELEFFFNTEDITKVNSEVFRGVTSGHSPEFGTR